MLCVLHHGKMESIAEELGWINFGTTGVNTGSLVTSPTYSFPGALWDSRPSCHASASQKHSHPPTPLQTKAGMANTFLLPLDKSLLESEI